MDEQNNVTEQTNVDNTNYIEAIKEIKQNSVDKAAYEKLKEENKQLLNSIVNGQTLEQPQEQSKPDIDALRKKLFANTRQDLTNLDFVTTALELRQALIDNGEIDPFVPVGNKIKPTSEDFDKAEKYVLDNFVWTDNMELIAQKLQKISKTLNGRLETELADKLSE